MVLPWALFGGFACECVDLLNDNHIKTFPSGGSIRFSQGNILDWDFDRENTIVFAFPPCTHLAVAGAKHFKNKGLSKLIEGLTLVERCRLLGERSPLFMLENPVGTLSTYWREPDYIFNPYEYGGYLESNEQDGYSKKTCLWTNETFVMPPKKEIANLQGSKMHTTIRDPQERAIFPVSFAYAVYLFNNHLMK